MPSLIRTRAFLVLPALALVGCTTTEIDAGKAEDFVRDNVGGSPRSVECPDGVEANTGDTFECRVQYADGRRATVTLHIRNDEGQISIGPGDVKPAR